jgi:hypothetical protein
MAPEMRHAQVVSIKPQGIIQPMKLFNMMHVGALLYGFAAEPTQRVR